MAGPPGALQNLGDPGPHALGIRAAHAQALGYSISQLERQTSDIVDEPVGVGLHHCRCSAAIATGDLRDLRGAELGGVQERQELG